MGSLSTPLSTIPTIHFSEKTIKTSAIREDVWNALVEFGCFEAVYDQVPLELHNAAFGLIKDFYDLPVERKSQYKCSKPFFGYVPKRPRSPLSELLGIEDSTSSESLEDFINQVWPEGKPDSSEILHSYVTKVAELEKMVKKMVMEILGVEKYYESFDSEITYSLRLMKYEGPMTDEIKLGVGDHTDKNFLTILQQNQVDGLEVETKNGECIKLNPAANSFVVMVGDPFYAWTNGRVHAPNHRVMVSGYQARYSMGLFSYAKEGCFVKCPEELVDEEHPLLFKPFDHNGFVSFFTSEAGLKAEATRSTLKVYAGL